MDYFKFYQLPISFYLDEGALRRQYLLNSKKYHPDFYTLESDEKQAEVLDLSTLNNQAYNTLKDFDARLKYILEQKGLIGEGLKNQLPPDFLMEMMEVNEQLMELQFDPSPEAKAKVEEQVEGIETDLLKTVENTLQNYNDETASEKELHSIRDYYLKKRYLWRIRENMEKVI